MSTDDLVASPPIAAEAVHRDRVWWAEEAARVGTDWVHISEAAAALLAICGLRLAPTDEWPTDFRRLCDEADRRRDRRVPPAVWSAAGRCVSRLPPRKALRTFLTWCDQHDIVRTDAMFVFETIVDKELAK